MDSQEDEITKEVLDLLQKIASQQNNGFLTLVLEDEDINNFINLCAASGSSGSVHLVDHFFSVLAKASTASCNMVFDTIFLCLLDNVRVSDNTFPKDVPAMKYSLPQQKLNFSVHLCIDILDACKELAVASVQLASKSDFMNNAWCQMLVVYTSSFMKALVFDLVPSTKEMDHEANFSLKGPVSFREKDC